MKNAEMQVLRFDAGDVIATSGIVCGDSSYSTASHFYVEQFYEDGNNSYFTGTKYEYNQETEKLVKVATGFSLNFDEALDLTGESDIGKWCFYDSDGYWYVCDGPHN